MLEDIAPTVATTQQHLQCSRLINRSCAKIETQHWFSTSLLTELNKLVCTKSISLLGFQCEITPPRTHVLRAHTVQPLITTQKISAQIPDRSVVQFTQGSYYIGAQPIGISKCRLRVIDSLIDTTAHMLGKATKEQRRYLADRPLRINKYFRSLIWY